MPYRSQSRGCHVTISVVMQTTLGNRVLLHPFCNEAISGTQERYVSDRRKWSPYGRQKNWQSYRHFKIEVTLVGSDGDKKDVVDLESRGPRRQRSSSKHYETLDFLAHSFQNLYHSRVGTSETTAFRGCIPMNTDIIGTNVSAAYFGLYGNLPLQGSYIVFYVVCSALVFYRLLRDDIDGPGAAPRR